MSSEPPTLVFVPGAWHQAMIWDKVTSALSSLDANIKCISLTMPTATADPSKSLVDDVKFLRQAIMGETSEGREVVLVCHSYGGVVGGSAVKGLTVRQRKDSPIEAAEALSTHGHVIGLCLVAPFFHPTGQTYMEAANYQEFPWFTTNWASGYVELNPDPRDTFYHDLSPQDAEFWASKLCKQSLKCAYEGAEVAYAGWMDVPVWYLACTDDQALPFVLQQSMIEMAQGAGADVKVKELKGCSHSPMLSRPTETAAFIREAVAGMLKGGETLP